jgi:cell volume regulation protein A
MHTTEPEPWALGMRFRDEPSGLRRYVVGSGSPADGCTLADLQVGESFWVSMVSRGGRLVQVRGDTTLRAGDEVLALAEDDDRPDHLFGPAP